MSAESKIRVAISQGDINGVGWEVILKTFSDPAIFEWCTPVVYGNTKTAAVHRKTLGNEEYQYQQVREGETLHSKRLNVINVYEEDVPVEFGKATVNGGKYALRSLEAASEAVLTGKADVLVTAPINKHTIQSEQFPFAGHTAFLQKKFNTPDVLMLLCSRELRVGLVTDHIPVSDIAALLTADRILQCIVSMNRSLVRDFGIRKPRIAVLGLNPHAGDMGTLGTEEATIILPAVTKAKDMNITVFGPYAADGFFGNGSYNRFDGILAMYHDQGLAPFKALSFSEGVNFTAGLPVVRTSPDHGTGFDIAGQNKANENSFRQAVYFAMDVFRKRKEYSEINANPLQVQQQRKER
ncbi:MAG: 4-hydroxythreonine-4-phosphate dehydrogenase PdxA [Bacteroidia bacterium]|nr:4-hydroxythreonine-4-phosphate dehydrogenase PdxA [Bacteroidia bacterium]